jgi:hypothetical protein
MEITSGHDVGTVAGRLGHAKPAMTLRVSSHVVELAVASLRDAVHGPLRGGELDWSSSVVGRVGVAVRVAGVADQRGGDDRAEWSDAGVWRPMAAWRFTWL